MFYLKKLSKSLGISLAILLIITLLITLFNYIGLIGLKIVTVFSYITPFISIFIGSLLLGKTSNNKGWLEGIKYGLIFICYSFTIVIDILLLYAYMLLEVEFFLFVF